MHHGYNITTFGIGISHCPFKLITGLPCPGCGGIMSTYSLLHGDIVKAIEINPLSILVNIFILISIVWIVVDITANRDSYFKFIKEKKIGKPVSITLIVIVIFVWVLNFLKSCV